MSKPNIVQPIYTVFLCPHFQCKVMKPFEISWLNKWLMINISQQLHGRSLLKKRFKLVRRQLSSHHFSLKYMKSLWTFNRFLIPVTPFLKYHFLFWTITPKTVSPRSWTPIHYSSLSCWVIYTRAFSYCDIHFCATSSAKHLYATVVSFPIPTVVENTSGVNTAYSTSLIIITIIIIIVITTVINIIIIIIIIIISIMMVNVLKCWVQSMSLRQS